MKNPIWIESWYEIDSLEFETHFIVVHLSTNACRCHQEHLWVYFWCFEHLDPATQVEQDLVCHWGSFWIAFGRHCTVGKSHLDLHAELTNLCTVGKNKLVWAKGLSIKRFDISNFTFVPRVEKIFHFSFLVAHVGVCLEKNSQLFSDWMVSIM